MKKLRPYVDIGITILKFKNGNYEYVAHLDTEYQREVFLEVELDPGNYLVVPRTIGICLKQF